MSFIPGVVVGRGGVVVGGGGVPEKHCKSKIIKVWCLCTIVPIKSLK